MAKDLLIKKLRDLPKGVKANLPKHAQEIYMKAYNNAWEQYKDPKKRWAGGSRKETAHRVAWNAVKKEYEKNEKGRWVKKK
ncbi:MAG: ChaB family protein [Nanoarchaeota archaeon]|nr:ChaB family protein [Nanoarchaeota archaeon]